LTIQFDLIAITYHLKQLKNIYKQILTVYLEYFSQAMAFMENSVATIQDNKNPLNCLNVFKIRHGVSEIRNGPPEVPRGTATAFRGRAGRPPAPKSGSLGGGAKTTARGIGRLTIRENDLNGYLIYFI
jgi:hypothetical protein